MGELGERLRAAREGKGLSLEDVAEGTRISLHYLKALEEESFGLFTSVTHARGFLRSYASYLGLDPEEMAVLHASLQGNRYGRREAAAAPMHPAVVRHGSTRSADVLLALVVAALLALVAFSVYRLRIQPQVEPGPTAGPLPTPSVTPMPAYRGTEYTMSVDLNYPEHRAKVRERIDYTNATSQTLTDLVLNVYPNHTRNAFKLNDLRLEMGGERTKPEVAPVEVRLAVPLPRELKPQEHVAIDLSFELSLPQIPSDAEFSAGSFGYSKRSLSLGNWYPVMAPYREDKGWYGLTYFPVGDPYVTEVADYHVSVTATHGVILAGTGKESRSGDVWHFEVEGARSFALAASDRYTELTRQSGAITAHVYAFAGDDAGAAAALETTAQSLALFEELYGPYPYSDYRIAETEFSGGMEFTALTFLGSPFLSQYDGTPHSLLIPLVAHEVAHQWFYSLVGSDQVTEPWLDEALAEYSSFLYYERYLPEDTPWWWSNVIDQWAPTGKIDSLIYEFRNNRAYVDAVYRRGAEFVRDLRKTMTDPAFFALLKEYGRRYAYRLATSKDFFALVREFTTADLVPLQEEYFRRVLP